MNDGKLWKVFSEFIRLRDSDEQGYCRCYTCGRVIHWRYDAQAGHGIPRQHWGTRYNEWNVKSQCKKCNFFEGGKRESFKEKMDFEHGKGTWDLMELKGKSVSRITKFEIEVMIKFYSEEVKKLKKEKGL